MTLNTTAASDNYKGSCFFLSYSLLILKITFSQTTKFLQGNYIQIKLKLRSLMFRKQTSTLYKTSIRQTSSYTDEKQLSL